MTARAVAAVVTASALLAGCAGLVSRPAVDVLAGRLSVSVQGDSARSFNAAFELEGSAERGRLVLATPLGTQLARAEWSPQQVTLRSREGERSYPDLESLAGDAFGERIPLAALVDWLRGRPWPGASSRARPGGFEQLGWQVDLSRHVDGWVVAERLAAPVISVRAKLDAPGETAAR